jgi:putative lipoprotein
MSGDARLEKEFGRLMNYRNMETQHEPHFLGILIFMGALALLSGCTEQTPHPNPVTVPGHASPLATGQTYVYECSDGYRFTARLESENAWLFLPDQTVRFLPPAVSGSGAKYSDGVLTFWSKGEEALLEARGESHRECRNNAAKAIWEGARLRGIDFRAVGNEPGWHLEITEGERIVFVTDYGETRYEFAAPDPPVDRLTAVTTYEISDREHELIIMLKDQLCHDSMSGEAFETTVIVSLNGKEYRGCGRHLY